MTFHVVRQPHPTPAQSPYRVAQKETGREVIWVNHFLDRECVRCLAETTLRSYALDLLHFLRWSRSGSTSLSWLCTTGWPHGYVPITRSTPSFD